MKRTYVPLTNVSNSIGQLKEKHQTKITSTNYARMLILTETQEAFSFSKPKFLRVNFRLEHIDAFKCWYFNVARVNLRAAFTTLVIVCRHVNSFTNHVLDTYFHLDKLHRYCLHASEQISKPSNATDFTLLKLQQSVCRLLWKDDSWGFPFVFYEESPTYFRIHAYCIELLMSKQTCM